MCGITALTITATIVANKPPDPQAWMAVMFFLCGGGQRCLDSSSARHVSEAIRRLVELGLEAKEMRSETKRWTTEEDDILRQAALAGTSVAEIASTVGRTESAVRARAYVLRVLLRPVGITRRGSVWQPSGA